MSVSGQLIVLSGPSGVGKGKLCEFLQGAFPDIHLSVSATSRPKRQGETDGVDYHFKTTDAFEAMIEANELFEWAQYNSSYYGTPRESVEGLIGAGKHVLLEIDVQGAMKVKQSLPQAVLIFIAPPTLEDLQTRLKARGQNSTTDIQSRMVIAKEELTYQDCFDHVLINGDFMACTQELMTIVSNHLEGIPDLA